MGKIYKLKPEIQDFILGKKRAEPNLSCRELSVLIFNTFQIKISKSSVNFVIREAGLSMPAGRRRKKVITEPVQMPLKPQQLQPQEEIKLLAPPKEMAPKEIAAKEASVEPRPCIQEPKQEPLEEQPAEVVAAKTPQAEAPEVTVAKIEEAQEGSYAESIAFPGAGGILLKAADSLLGGTYYINQNIAQRLNLAANKSLVKTEALLYRSLGMDFGLKPQDISSYLNALQQINTLSPDIVQIISNVFKEARCLKLILLDESSFYLDGQLYTLWSTPQIPYDFSASLYNIEDRINKTFRKDNPLVLFTAPGYETYTKELFDFILNLEANKNQISEIILYGHKLEEIKAIRLDKGDRRFFVFGLWPWQFGQFRNAKIKGEYKLFYFEPLRKELYLAELGVDLSQPKINKRVTLRGVALKAGLNDDIRLIILSNLPSEKTPSEIAGQYLNHWPNLEEGFQYFSRKIELFTYTTSSRRLFSLEGFKPNKEILSDIGALFNLYLEILDLYVKCYFLPMGYEDKDFSAVNERFYSLRTLLKEEKDYFLVTFLPPSGYSYLRDLEYAIYRINERKILFPNGKRLWCSL